MSSSSGSATAQAQAQVLLRTLCKIMLPHIQTAPGQTLSPDNIDFGNEAEEFANELEKFISGVISRSQPRNEDITIETRLGKDSFYRSEGVGDGVTVDASSDDEGRPEHPPTNQGIQDHVTIPQAMPTGVDEKVLSTTLQILGKHVTQKMPIRLLCFEPHNSKLKISLIERADIYKHLVLKYRANFDEEPIHYINPWISKNAGYAILSHTWNQTPGELTYGDWQKGLLDTTQPKCGKLLNFCKAAYEDHGLTFGWIDTVCINKESSAELDESIRSMYIWYRDAKVCITYLAGSKIVEEIHSDPWFTRGWTLQELVAPQRIKFYNMDWKQLSGDSDDKRNHSIQEEIRLATTMSSAELQYIRGKSISRRMQLAAKRQVTREEDIAYCLMGIFDVSISTAYGEGAERAFFRLLEEIFRSTKEVSDIFNWAGERSVLARWQPTTSLFPSLPSDYLNRSEKIRPWHPIEPMTITHLGLRTPILLMPAVPILESVRPYLPSASIGDYHADVFVSLDTSVSYTSSLPKNYRLLDKRISGPEGMYKMYRVKVTLTFGALNVEEQVGTCIRIPKSCLAVLLKRQVEPFSPGYKREYTKEPIVFDLVRTGNNLDADVEDKRYYEVERSQLANHGMQLVTLYL